MVSSRGALSVFEPVVEGVTSALAMVFGFLNMLFLPVEKFIEMVLEYSTPIMRFQWLTDFSLAAAAVLFIYLTKTLDVGAGGDSQFLVSEQSVRGLVFITSLALLLVTSSAVLGRVFESSTPIKSLFNEFSFSREYDVYLATFKHGVHSLLLVSIAFMWGLHDDRKTFWSWNDSDALQDDSTATGTFLTVLFIVLLVSKFLSETRHGEDARVKSLKKETIGESVELRSDRQFKHARGAALTVATGLLVYLVVNLGGSKGFFEFLGSKTIALTLSVYILVVSLERIAGRREWVVGGAGGLVVTGIVSTLNLIFAGTAVAEDKSTVSIVVALGVIFLDAMRVGYGQKVPEVGVVSDVRKVLLRLAQAVIGILMFRYVTSTAEGDQAASSPYLEGVAIASSLIKIVGVSYIGKDLFKTSTEHHYRELASTGLLLTSAYLWIQPFSSEGDTPAIVYLVLGITCRFLDSIMNFLMSGKDALAYISWDKADQGEGINSPTSDNPRTWLTLLGLLASLVFTSMAMNDRIDLVKLGEDRPLDEAMSNSMIVAVTFIAVHVAVVLAGLLSEIQGAGVLSIAALSRSKFVRFAVTTTVLSSLAVAAGAVLHSDQTTDKASSESVLSEILSALVAYVFADVVGRELL